MTRAATPLNRLVPPALQQVAGVQGMISPDDVRSSELQAGFALWNRLRGTRAFPSRDLLSPRSLGRLLRNVILIKVLDDGAEFQIRIMGDGILAVQSDPLTGLTTKEVDERLPGYGTGLHSLYSFVCRTKVPIAFRGTVHREADSRSFHREHLLVPLGDSDDEVDHLISFIVYLTPQV